MPRKGETVGGRKVRVAHVRIKKALLPIEWTNMVVEHVPIAAGALLAKSIHGRPARDLTERGNFSRATRLAASRPRRMVQVFA